VGVIRVEMSMMGMVGGMVVVGLGDGRMGWFCVEVQFVCSCECLHIQIRMLQSTYVCLTIFLYAGLEILV